MKHSILLGLCGSIAFSIIACKTNTKDEPANVQEIVDRSIEDAGGDKYTQSMISFDFRDYTYIMERQDQQRVLKRIITNDSAVITDVLSGNRFERFVNDSLVTLHDTTANKYANAINSVHYFAYLPYGLNDAAVNKELLGKVKIKDQEYYKVKVTFDQNGGGDDFEDVFVYWFNTSSLKPDYLAYEYHTNGGGLRFRAAFNERYVGGIRFVDYHNLKHEIGSIKVTDLDRLFEAGELELLSEIELKNIEVNRDNYN